MAKKKKEKTSKKGISYAKELEGLILILVSITGLGNFGIVGSLMKKFAIFLFGTWYTLGLVLALALGIYLIVKRNKPNYLSGRMIGIYAIVLALLLFSHTKYISNNKLTARDIFTKTFDNISASYEQESEIRNTGGGIIGATSSWAFVSLFDVEGTSIVIVIISLFGLIMLFEMNLSDLCSSIADSFRNMKNKKEEKKQVREEQKQSRIRDIEEEEEKPIDKRVVITSVENLQEQLHKDDTVGTLPPAKEVEKTEEVTDSKPYKKPSIQLLNPSKSKGKVNSTEFITANTKILERVFTDFGIKAKVIEVHVGPAVTQYEMELERGTKVNKVLSISREIALALAAKEVRIEAPIPGKNTVGVEIPNQTIMAVSMREIMEDLERNPKYKDSKLAAPLGRDIMGNVKCVEINKTPHMLVAGATGSGKSVCINNIILAILMRATPEEVKMVLVDPKKVEFNVYEGIPHLLTPVVTDPKKASAALQKIVVEMDERYETFKNSGTKNIQTYNDYVEKKLKSDPNCGLTKMPFILVVIDELADLMLVAAKEVEESIMRITQLARAAGIHLIVATQRPSTDIITGVVKSNIPTRISFAVSSSIDSRTILDMVGAEKLLGKGDMLYKPMDDNTPTRIQGSFVGDDEIERVVNFVKENCNPPKYNEKFTNLDSSSSGSENSHSGESGGGGAKDVLYDEILNYAIRMGQISASLIQRKYSIGYNRAARIMDQFEEQGLVGPAKGSKPRDVLVKLESQGGNEE
ncbi:MAG: DNA translocase FtsK [Tenericutes bacterium]|nr:DNA translocase FtsK [Mycoplasmatota bacterium]